MEDAREAADRGDFETALAIWGPLAHAGVPRAQNNIGACFAGGLGVERNTAVALRWLTLAAEAGDAVGQRNLAALHFKGDGVEQSDVEARRWYRAAAENGDCAAQDMLSWMLLEGDDKADLPEVRRWAEAAAGSGVAPSMTRLGMMYHEALGVERDAVVAAQWWRRGADAGDADAQAMLGAAMLLGQGAPKDGIGALALLLRAERNGSLLATQFLKPARASLTPEELIQATEAAR
jgi:hypothetical protein